MSDPFDELLKIRRQDLVLLCVSNVSKNKSEEIIIKTQITRDTRLRYLSNFLKYLNSNLRNILVPVYLRVVPQDIRN